MKEMDLEIVSHCVGPLTRDYLSKLPHHVPPCMNLHRLFPVKGTKNDISSSLVNQFPYETSLPAPLIPVPQIAHEALNGIDSTTTLVRDKIRWQMKKEKIVSAVKKDKKNISAKTIKRAESVSVDETTQISRGVALLASHLDKDPDPQFNGVYNWYYTGGTLGTLNLEKDYYLLHADCGKLNGLEVNPEQYEFNTSLTLDLGSSDVIYQIATNKVGAGVRQKSCVSIFAVTESKSGLAMNKVHSVTDERNKFLSVALRDKSIQKYCTLSNTGILKMWDIEYSKNYKAKLTVSPGEGVTVSDSWSSIMFIDNKTLLLVDRCCLHILDTRAGMQEKQLAWCPRKLTEQCEELSLILSSKRRDNIVYSMTTHQALTLDLRFGFCQRWTHMMAAPPYVGFTHSMDHDQELVCIGSQVASDCVALVNNWKEEDPQSVHRPMSLPSPAQGLHLARQQGLCLEPTLIQRCTQSTVGITMMPADNGVHILRQSATGDIFMQQLGSAIPGGSQLSEQQLRAFTDWCRPISRDSTILSASDVKDFTPLLKELSAPLSSEETSSEEKKIGGGWRLSKQYLEECIDLLAPRLLEVWEVEDEEEWEPQQEEETLIEQDPTEKVQNWLDTGNVTCNDMSTLKPKVTSTPYVQPIPEREEDEISQNFSLEEEEPSPWMTQTGQVLLRTPQKPIMLFHPSPSSLSPPFSLPSPGEQPPHKKQRLFDDSVIGTPSKQPVSAKKLLNSEKKKFIPGF